MLNGLSKSAVSRITPVPANYAMNNSLALTPDGKLDTPMFVTCMRRWLRTPQRHSGHDLVQHSEWLSVEHERRTTLLRAVVMNGANRVVCRAADSWLPCIPT